MVNHAGQFRASHGDCVKRARGELIAFFSLTFAITWGLGAVILFFRQPLEALVGPLGPLNQSWPYYIAVSAPTIAALLLSLAFGGFSGLKTLARGLVRPMRPRWIALAILTWPAVLAAWAVIARIMPGAPRTVDLYALLIGAPLLLLTTPIAFADPGALGEEFGWRGFALPRLLRLFSPLTAALILGLIWVVWHIPAFFTSGLSQSTFNFVWFLIMLVALSVFMAWLFVNTNGNFLVAGIVPHALLNLVFDARVTRDLPTEAITMALIAVILVAAFGKALRAAPRDRAPHAPSPLDPR
ncbi:MAG: CPBP family intramembrane metalloprotease [Pseudomonadota bacterium]|nr:CPBP family intramembrane metalloprotease [Pseudomonadota bacterium]